MKEYKSVIVSTIQGWGSSKGTINTEALDEVLNSMAREGWELQCLQDLEHGAGSASLVCVFWRAAKA